MSETVERHEFGAEVGRLLDLVVHALYSDREIFLRELVANAADATDRRRFEALTNEALALPSDARVLIALGHDPVDVDALVHRTSLTPEALSAILLSLELEGRVARLPGGRLQRL